MSFDEHVAEHVNVRPLFLHQRNIKEARGCAKRGASLVISGSNYFCDARFFREQTVNEMCLKGQLWGMRRQLPDKLCAVGG